MYGLSCFVIAKEQVLNALPTASQVMLCSVMCVLFLFPSLELFVLTLIVFKMTGGIHNGKSVNLKGQAFNLHNKLDMF